MALIKDTEINMAQLATHYHLFLDAILRVLIAVTRKITEPLDYLSILTVLQKYGTFHPFAGVLVAFCAHYQLYCVLYVLWLHGRH